MQRAALKLMLLFPSALTMMVDCKQRFPKWSRWTPKGVPHLKGSTLAYMESFLILFINEILMLSCPVSRSKKSEVDE